MPTTIEVAFYFTSFQVGSLSFVLSNVIATDAKHRLAFLIGYCEARNFPNFSVHHPCNERNNARYPSIKWVLFGNAGAAYDGWLK
jgi:hypothetical protein